MNKENIIKSANYNLLSEYVWLTKWAVQKYFNRNKMKINNSKDVKDYLKHREMYCSWIYQIVNNINWRKYIWSTRCMYDRKMTHFSLLKNNRHSCKEMQSDYNKYWLENFVFVVLYKIDDAIEYRNKEKELINISDKWILYNYIDTELDVWKNLHKNMEYFKDCLMYKKEIQEFIGKLK